MIITANVTQACIDNAGHKTTDCPIAQSFCSVQGASQPIVGCMFLSVTINNANYHAFIPREAREFINAYDNDKHVEPQRFTFDFQPI